MSRVSLIVCALAACCTATARADAPIFQGSSYSFEISLHDTDEYVGTVHAIDPEWDNFHYELDDPSGMFQIDYFHGYITASSWALEVGTYTVTVAAVDCFDEWSSVNVVIEVTPAPPPVIVNTSVYNYGGGMMVIAGTVDSSTPSGTVKFGGLLIGKSASYGPGGGFMLMTSVYGVGSISMQAVDADGQLSNVVYRNIHP